VQEMLHLQLAANMAITMNVGPLDKETIELFIAIEEPE
jgi:hypothetical protein